MINSLEGYDLIVIDTSILLSLYEYPVQIVSDTIKILKENEDKIWLPNQVFKEFNDNIYKNKFKEKAISNYDSISNNLNSIVDCTKNDFFNNLNIYHHKHFPKINDLKININQKLLEIKDLIKKYNSTLKEDHIKNKIFHKEEIILKFINHLNNIKQVGPCYSPKKLLEIYSEGEKRYLYKIPPGYMDDLLHNKNAKSTPEKFGDLLVWKQFLDYVSNENFKILFVTNDKKEDWVFKTKFRQELLSELSQYSPDSSLFKLDLDEFLDTVKNNFSLNSKLSFDFNKHIKNLCENGELTSNIEYQIKDYIYGQITNPNILKEFISPTNLQVDFFKSENISSLILNKECPIEIIEDFDTSNSTINFINKSVETSIHFSGILHGKINNFLEASFDFNGCLEIVFDISIENLENIIFNDQDILSSSFSLNSIDLENKDICFYCNSKEGTYKTENGDFFCHSCFIKLF